MGTILIVTEIQKGVIREASFELASYAQKLGGDVKSLVVGEGVKGLAEDFAKRGGGEVHVAEHAELANYSADAQTQAVLAAVSATGADTILISNTPSGWDFAPRVASALDAAFVTDAFGVEDDGGKPAFLRRVFNGKLDARLKTSADVVVATMQPGGTAAFEAPTERSVKDPDSGIHVSHTTFFQCQ